MNSKKRKLEYIRIKNSIRKGESFKHDILIPKEVAEDFLELITAHEWEMLEKKYKTPLFFVTIKRALTSGDLVNRHYVFRATFKKQEDGI